MKVYTTGEVSKIIGCSPRTTTKFIDSGLLKGYRLPLSKDRRVRHSDLIAFMVKNNIPTEDIKDE